MKVGTAVTRIVSTSLLMALAGYATAQQGYPNRPIRFITPYAPGGSSSAFVRIVGEKLTEHWGQQVLVDNRPGGSGFIGGEALAKSPPDGYTVMLIAGTHILTPLLLPAPYDAIKDFSPVATICSSTSVLVIHPSVPAKTMREFIALAKARPGQLNFGSSGTGGGTHMNSELLFFLAGIKLQHIPYKGAGQSQIDLIGGQIQALFTPTINVLQQIKAGKLRALAISGDTRQASLPQVPTLAEAGVPGYDVKSWFGVIAPARTPKDIVDKLSAEIARILAMPDTIATLTGQGMEPFISTPEQFGALMKEEAANWVKVIKTTHIKIEN